VHPRRAKALRDELAVSIRRGEFVQPSKQTLAQWLNVWLDESVRSARRGNTVLSYQSLIANHIIPALGGVQLQALRSGHLSKYYAEKARAGLSSGTLGVRLIRFGGHLSKGEYDVHTDGRDDQKPASPPTV
jgi:predicted ABC-type transport system involved in lysophospholipase L1 biosynthesis ATPase subunit